MSDKITIKIAINSHLPEATEALGKALTQWGERTGSEMVNLTHRDRGEGGTPVDTGRLRNSMTYATSEDHKTVYVGSNVEYAQTVEEGERGRSGAHMLRNAVMDVGDDAEQYLKEALEDSGV